MSLGSSSCLCLCFSATRTTLSDWLHSTHSTRVHTDRLQPQRRIRVPRGASLHPRHGFRPQRLDPGHEWEVPFEASATRVICGNKGAYGPWSQWLAKLSRLGVRSTSREHAPPTSFVNGKMLEVLHDTNRAFHLHRPQQLTASFYAVTG